MFEDNIFGDLDVASADDDPFKIPAGVYPTIVTEVSVVDNADKTKKSLVIKRTIVEGGKAGRILQTWHNIPKRLSPEDMALMTDEAKQKYQEALSFLKKEMLNLGVPESRINQTKPEDLIGLPSVLTVKHKAGSDYPSIYSRAAKPGEVVVPEGGISTVSSGGSNPFDD
jgi:hypothetical protein